jgi:glycosyltransferase involved in cell wall biosynthesis
MKYILKQICIITQSHLCRNPRVVKEALLLVEKGYTVTIINSTYDHDLNAQDIHIIEGSGIELLHVAQLEKRNLTSFLYRWIKKTGNLLVKYLKIQTPMALGYASWEYVSVALKQHADLYICHQELGLYCGVCLLKHNKKVAFDFEDWYAEDLLPDAQIDRPLKLLRRLEHDALNQGAFCLTTSNIMARQLAATYHSPVPNVVYNTFDVETNILTNTKAFTSPLKLFWFSQTIGPGRGLEEFLQLINSVPMKLEIHLLGMVSDSYKNFLLQMPGPQHQLLFHSLVAPDKLAAKIAQFDIGLALELSTPQSRNYTITNKLFQYLMSGLPIIATNTMGQQEVINKYNVGISIDFNDIERSLNRLMALFNDSQRIKDLSQQARKMAAVLSWDAEKEKLFDPIESVFNEQ